MPSRRGARWTTSWASDRDKKVKRVVFYEITEGAVKDAVKHPRTISMDLVNAQQARRALDYLVGFRSEQEGEARGLLRDHRRRRERRRQASAHHFDGPGECPAGAARAGLPRGLQPVAAALEEDPPRVVRRPRAEPGAAPHR